MGESGGNKIEPAQEKSKNVLNMRLNSKIEWTPIFFTTSKLTPQNLPVQVPLEVLYFSSTDRLRYFELHWKAFC